MFLASDSPVVTDADAPDKMEMESESEFWKRLRNTPVGLQQPGGIGPTPSPGPSSAVVSMVSMKPQGATTPADLGMAVPLDCVAGSVEASQVMDRIYNGRTD